MAAVYSSQEGSLQVNINTLSSENKKDVSQDQNICSVSSDNVLNTDRTSVEGRLKSSGSELKAQEHAEVAATDVTVPQIRIKEEQVEENEYITVHLSEVEGEDSEEQTARKADLPGTDESTDGDWPFRCEDCSEAFVNKELYQEHRREHTHDGPIVCLDTDSQWDDLLVSTDGGRRTLCCALCGRKFSSSRGFFTHQLKHRNQVIKKESISDIGQSTVKQKLFECRDCGKTFASIGQCLNHQRSHKQASKSVFHQLAHLKKKSFQCPTCGRSYSRASALDAHRRCHEVKLVKSRGCETEKPVTEASFKMEEITDTTSAQLDRPQKKLFECLCGKAFRTLCGLGTHQRFSANCSNVKVKMEVKRSFECTECGKTFVSSVALSCHQRWHKRRAQLLCSGQPFKCKECGRVFTSLTFYNKHQRLAHSKEMPAKSFLHQVYQLQKKAFECRDCGRRFSRASALHSHQLCHTDVFSDIIERCSKSPPVDPTPRSDQSDEDETFSSTERDLNCDAPASAEDNEVVDDSFEIISVTASDGCRSENGSQQDQNPDLELLCESDQEEKEDFCFNLSQESEPVSSQINPEMNVKIVHIDYEHLKGGLVSTEMDRSPHQDAKKYDCPVCDRTFVKAMSLRCHMLWHRGGMGKKSRFRRKIRIMTPIRKASIKCEICGHESFTKTAHYFHLGKHEDRKPYKSITYQLANLQKNGFKCEVCGMHFSRLSALHSHQQHHKNAKKPYACLQCDKSYSNPSGLYNHRKVCCSKNPGSPNDTKMEHFNPTKTLLGPKVHHCKKCGKGFWSLGAFFHHKQHQPQCAEANARIATASLESENGCIRRKRRGRKRGILYGRHTRKAGALSDHVESKEEHKCDVCGKSYRMLACFLKHQLVHSSHENPPPAKSFDYQVEQLKKNSYSCPDCGKRFSRAMALQFHMKSHGYETGLPTEKTKLLQTSDGPQCHTCLAFFTCESALQIHQKLCLKPNGGSKEQVDGYQKQELEKLSASHENNSVENQTFETVKDKEPTNQLKTLPSVTADLKYKCDVCGRSFSVVGALNFHKRIHSQGHVSSKLKSELRSPSKVKSKDHPARAPFVCSECGRSFSTNSALGTHRRWHNDKKLARILSKNSKVSKKTMNSGPFLCNLCGKGFFYLCVLRRHQKHHPPIQTQSNADHKGKTELGTTYAERSIACPDCDKSFSSGSLLASHFACHHTKPSNFVEEPNNSGDGPLGEQRLCEPSKAPVNPQRNNLAKAKGEKLKMKYQCPHCYRSFMNIRGLRAHKWQKHRRARGRPAAGSDGADKPFPCSRCEKRYSSQGALYNHKRSCSANNVDQKQSLKPVKPHITDVSSLPHRPLETTKCLFKCHKCGKAFPSEAQLDVHKEAARTRPHCCALCCRGYWTETQLQQHLAWHDEVRRRLPTELRYRLSASVVSGPSPKLQAPAPHPAGRDSVSLIKEPTAPTNTLAHKNHKCHQCGKTFLSPRALEQHRAFHKNEEPYHCSLCPQAFGEIRDLIDHHQECLGNKELRDTGLSASRDVESLTCIECGISFSQETDLHEHYIEHARGAF